MDLGAELSLISFCLIFNAHNFNREIIKFLVKSGMDINEKDEHGKTAFWNAYEKGRIDLETQLIKLGADINTTNLEGITPLEDAKARGFKR